MSYTCYSCFQEKPNNDACPFCGYEPEQGKKKYPLALPEGTILGGRYIVGRVLGEGGFGITYIAQEYATKRLVAIKEYLPGEMATRTATNEVTAFSEQRLEDYAYGKARFLEEAKTLAEFQKEDHIVSIYSFFEENNTAYFAMEYVDGINLQQYMREQGGRLTPDEAGRLLRPVMEAVGKIHRKGIVHRDISPDNILITEDGAAKLIDFGAARYSIGQKSMSLDVVLKHGFAPIEQYSRRGKQGPFTDVYAMAATYYYAITGKLPPDAIDRIKDDPLQLPHSLGIKIKKSQENALKKGLAVNAEDRWQSMHEFADALCPEVTKKEKSQQKEVSKKEPKQKKEKPVKEKKVKPKRRNNQIIAIVIAVLCLGLIIFIRKNILPDLKNDKVVEEQTWTEEQIQNEEQTRIEVGSNITFGFYDGQPIEWQVLAKEEDRILVISRYILFFEAYNESHTNVTWETCSLREKLNDSFLNTAFTKEERAMIPSITLSDNGSSENSISDQVFLLSSLEADLYFSTDEARRCVPSDYVYSQYEQSERYDDSYYVYKIDGKYTDWWWLRSPGIDGDYNADELGEGGVAACVYVDGRIYYQRVFAGMGVRPALWIEMGANKQPAINTTDDPEEEENSDNSQKSEEENQTQSKPYLGVELDSRYNYSYAQYYSLPQGAFVANVVEGSPAEKAGIEAGDIITKLGSYSVENYTDLKEAINHFYAGDTVELTVFRSEEEMRMSVTFDQLAPEVSSALKELKEASIGDYVLFGSYEQDNDTSNGKEDIEWLILDKEDDRILVISRYALDWQPYDTTFRKITWETCSLREWMNGTFLNEAFTEQERSRVPSVTVSADKNPDYITAAGNDTTDQVFLLSITEANKYFSLNEERQCTAIAYAFAQGANKVSNDNCWWWLRSPGYLSNYAAGVFGNGGISRGGNYVTDSHGVRPTLWIDLSLVDAS